jgi:hypothetical protein
MSRRRGAGGLAHLRRRAVPALGEHGRMDVVRRLVVGKEVGGDGPLVAPVAVEVERRADEAERPMLPAPHSARGSPHRSSPR